MYASPEQLSHVAVGHRTDLWTLGVVAFECLSGLPPFTGERRPRPTLDRARIVSSLYWLLQRPSRPGADVCPAFLV
jgi:serine/threonine protein kinase